MQLKGNTVLITGGSSGIGTAFAEKFYHAGSIVIICGRRKDKLDAIAANYPGMHTRVCDLNKAGDREDLSNWVKQNFAQTNILINNAGIQLATDLTHPVNLESLKEEIEVNLVAPLHLSSLFAEHLVQLNREAAIINISSGLAFAPLAFMPVYCATKAALHSASLSLRYQLRNSMVKVFEIIPPSTDTELGHQRRANKNESHGGLPVKEFIIGAMEAIRNDQFEAAIADAIHLREKGEKMFNVMNR